MADGTITVKDDHKLPLRVIDVETGETETWVEFCQRHIDSIVDREDERDLQKALAQVPKADVRTFAETKVAEIEAAEEAAKLEEEEVE